LSGNLARHCTIPNAQKKPTDARQTKETVLDLRCAHSRGFAGHYARTRQPSGERTAVAYFRFDIQTSAMT